MKATKPHNNNMNGLIQKEKIEFTIYIRPTPYNLDQISPIPHALVSSRPCKTFL